MADVFSFEHYMILRSRALCLSAVDFLVWRRPRPPASAPIEVRRVNPQRFVRWLGSTPYASAKSARPQRPRARLSSTCISTTTAIRFDAYEVLGIAGRHFAGKGRSSLPRSRRMRQIQRQGNSCRPPFRAIREPRIQGDRLDNLIDHAEPASRYFNMLQHSRGHEWRTVKYLNDLATLVSLCKRRGFIFQSSEIYGGLNSCWDYGPLGSQFKLNVKMSWWEAMTRRSDMVGLDAAILMHPTVWKASGHVDGFSDPLVDCKSCKTRFRQDTAMVEWQSCLSQV